MKRPVMNETITKSLFYNIFFFLLIGLSNYSYAQGPLTINIENTIVLGNQQARVDFTVENFIDITSMQFSINWDDSKLKLDSLSNKIDNQVFIGPTPFQDFAIISWVEANATGASYSDGSIIFSLYFTPIALGGSIIEITDSPREIEITRMFNSQIIVIPLITNQGSIVRDGGTVKGNIFNDADGNCIFEPGSEGFNGWQVVMEGTSTYYTSTDNAGNYLFIADTGDYQLSAIPPNDYWAPCQSYDLQLALNEEITQDIPINELISCPSMIVDVSTPFLRRCFINNYTINYCNQGTAAALGSTVELELDPAMNFIIASIPVQTSSGNLYTFDLGDVAVGECGAFTVEIILDCDSTALGQTHCVEAHIFPDQICTTPPAGWSGANIEVEGSCDGQELTFQIKNTGSGDMTEVSHYIVIEDVIMRTENSFQLNSGDALPEIKLPANGSTYRVEAYQVNQHPGFSMPSVTIEGCGTNSNGEISLGFVNQFAQNDANAFVSIDCQENIGAYDPNDKLAFPKGYGDEHFIEANTDIEYMIRFQNTGTDTAFNVKILDTLSTQLDMSKFQLGASSHPVELFVQGKDTVTLEFRFANIMLPDSNVNEAASHGFVKFKIAQKQDLEDGTLLTNDAGIYFDFNPPIQTNEVFHTIGREFVTVNTQEVFIPNVSLKAYPNPASEVVNFELDGQEFNQIRFTLFDLNGRLVRNEWHQNQTFEFRRKGLAAGVYIYKIESNGQAVSAGKLTLH